MTTTVQPTAAAAKATLNYAAITEHPTRLQCWSLLAERAMSPKEIAVELRQEVNHIAYHVRKLRDLGVIELVRTEPRRGATEHWYRCVAKPDMRAPDVGKLTPEESQAHAGHIVQLQVADVAQSLEAGTLVQRPDHAVIRFPLDLDDEGFAKLSRLLDNTLDQIYELQTETIERTKNAPEKRSVKSMVHLNAFEMPER